MAQPATTRTLPRGFTIVELLVTLLVVALLMGLLVVGFSHAIRLARRTAGTADVASLNIAVQQFKMDFSFLPPLVKDGFADTPDTRGPLITVNVNGRNRTIPNVYSVGIDADREFLREEGPGDYRYRFSVYSLAYYLMGALGEDVDGVEGPGARAPTRDGSFDRLSSRTYEPLYEARPASLETVDAEEGRIELRDGKGVQFRYYRWVRGTTEQADDDRAILNVPDLVAAGKDAAELGAADYAIVAAGPDGLFGDIGVESFPGQASDAPESLETLERIESVLGKRFRDEAEAQAAARSDNIVGVGQ